MAETTSLLSCCSGSFTCYYRRQNSRCFSTLKCKRVRILTQDQHACTKKSFYVCCATKGSADSSKSSEEKIPSWAKPDSGEPPPWAQNEGKQAASQQGFELPFIVYLLASAVTAIAAIGSVFEYINQRPVFGVLNSDSIFYAPVLGFFAFTGIPTRHFCGSSPFKSQTEKLKSKTGEMAISRIRYATLFAIL